MQAEDNKKHEKRLAELKLQYRAHKELTHRFVFRKNYSTTQRKLLGS